MRLFYSLAQALNLGLDFYFLFEKFPVLERVPQIFTSVRIIVRNFWILAFLEILSFDLSDPYCRDEKISDFSFFNFK